MSLVGSTDSSNTLQRTSNICSLNGRDDNSGLTAHILGSDKLSTMYSTDLYEDVNYEKYLFDSMAAELDEASSLSCVNDLHLSLAEISTHHLNSELPCLENLSPDSECYDEKQIRLQLQELERALLSDNDIADDDVFISQCTEISSELANPIQNELLQNSSVESPSLDSKLSSISCKTTKTPQELLLDCAAMLSEGNIEGTSVMINESRQIVSIQGDPPQRIAAYMVEGLAARVAASGKCLYKALKCKEPPSSDRLAAMQILFEVCPCFKFGFMAANGSIIEASKNERRVHIVDFDINQGSQYINLIQMLANQPGGKSQHFRLTGGESVQRPVGGMQIIGQRLEKPANHWTET